MVASFSLIIIALLVAVDQLIKLCIELWLKPMGTFPLVEGFLQLNYAENRGAAFGMLQNARWIFIVLTTVVMAAGVYCMVRKQIKNPVAYAGVVLILAGGAGNWIDRVFRGYVIDYIEPQFMNFAIFNFADCLVTVGAFLFIGYLFYDLVKDSKKKKAGEKSHA